MKNFLSIISIFILIISSFCIINKENQTKLEKKIFLDSSKKEYSIYKQNKDNNFNYSNETIQINFNNNENLDLIFKQTQNEKINIFSAECGENCKTKDKDGCKCLDCYDSYYLDDYDCKQCDTNCKTCEIASTQCTSCNDNYFLDSNTCSKCDSNCKTCDKISSQCTSCYDNHFLDNNKCSQCDSNCKSCEGKATTCTECYWKFFLYDGKCLDCANNCDTFGIDNCQCSICAKGYENIKNQCKQCEAVSPSCSEYEENKCSCIQCYYGSYLDKNTKLCKYCDNNCQSCEDTSTKCTSCDESHFLEDNQCYECTECEEKDPYTCKCTKCKEGKYLEKSQCKECDIECKTCIGKDLCSSCKDGYYYQRLKCLPCYDLCKTCSSGSSDPKNQLCEACKSNYVLLNNNCLDKCPEGYYEKDDSCELCNQLCKTSGANCNSCESCIDGYYLVKGEYRCNKCNEHCSTCSEGENGNNENCDTCNINSEYKYFVNATGFGKNCVKSCPNGTVVEGEYTCILKPKEDNGNTINKEKILIITFSIIGALLVIGIILYIIIRFKKRKRKIDDVNNKCDDKLIDEINKDLNLYQSFN